MRAAFVFDDLLSTMIYRIIKDKHIISNAAPFLRLTSFRKKQPIAGQWSSYKQRRTYSTKPQNKLFSSLSNPSSFCIFASFSSFSSLYNSSFSTSSLSSSSIYDHLIEFSPSAKEDVQHINIVPGFSTPEEETNIVKEISRTFRGKKYQYDHWDGAIEGYRETEKRCWTEGNMALIDRLCDWAKSAVKGEELKTLADVHVLDLAEDGEIKPHIDSVKFCGNVIAGVSLLSSSVMRLQHEGEPDKWINVLLPRRSLYCMMGEVRYCYTHAIPKGEESFMGQKIVRERRLSLICRTAV